MTKKLIFTISIILVLLISLSTTTCYAAVDVNYGYNEKTITDSLLLVNMDTNTTVYAKDADAKRYPASTTKIMTYIIVAEAIDDIDNTRVLIKQDILDLLNGTGSSLSGLSYHVGDKMTVKDLLYCLMVSSGNDASLVFADYIGKGNIQSFVDKMNEKAKELGCKNTHFTNPHGLHDDNHYTTAQDLYKITSYALTLPLFSEITNTTTYYCEGDDYPLVTTNFLIDQNRGGDYYYMYAQGIKTGTTNESGRCLVSTAIADGYAYMLIALHAPYNEDAENQDIGTMRDAKKIFRWALLNLELQSVLTTKTPVCEQKIQFAWNKESILLVPENNISAIVPQDAEKKDITFKTDIKELIDTPIKQGDVLGKATVYYKDIEIDTINLVASENVERSQLLFTIDVIKNLVTAPWFIITAVVAVILFILYLFVTSIYTKRSGKNKKVKRYRKL